MNVQIVHNESMEIPARSLGNVIQTLTGAKVICSDYTENIADNINNLDPDNVVFITSDDQTLYHAKTIDSKLLDHSPIYLINARNLYSRELPSRTCSVDSVEDIIVLLNQCKHTKKVLKEDYGAAFKADAKGLTAVLMDQFSEPLLCFRELVQNSMDAEAESIALNTSYDLDTKLLAIEVSDDGSGMTLEHINTYLTLFDSTKDTDITKVGQMGAGKVFAHALHPTSLIVETGDGNQGHKVIFNPDMSGKIIKASDYKGTTVKMFLPLSRNKAREFTKTLSRVVDEWCGYIKTPLFINGDKINRKFVPSGRDLYIDEPGLEAIISLGEGRYSREGRYSLFKGRIQLQKSDTGPYNRYEKGDLYSLMGGLINADSFDFPISRNGVVNDENYKNIFSTIRARAIKHFTPLLKEELLNHPSAQLEKISDFFLTIIANHGYNVLKDKELEELKELPLIASLNHKNYSVKELFELHDKHEVIYYTNNGLSAAESSTFVSKGIPVLHSPSHHLRESILGRLYKVCLDQGYLKGAQFYNVGNINFGSINDLLKKDFFSKITGGCGGGGSGSGGGFGNFFQDKDNYENPFNFSNMALRGAYFTDFHGNPDENVLLDVSHDYPTKYVTLNMNHPFMDRMYKLAEHDERLSQYYICCQLIGSKQIFSGVTDKLREREMTKVGLKVLQ